MTSRKKSASEPIRKVPQGKMTSLGLYVTAKEAYEMWRSDPDRVKIVDCRTTEEFLFVGHPPMAWNIPFALQVYEWDVEKRQFPMKPNQDFVKQVMKCFKPSDTLLVTCRSGGRSCLAINALAKAGFKNVYNIIDGVEGDMVCDPESVYHRQRMKNGWKNAGLPWTYEIVPDRILFPKTR